jgi:glycosyltransferase involved in cell wall biosynthesis
LKDADAIISPSSRYIDSSRLNAFARKTVAVPNGIDLSEYRVDFTREECRRTLGLPVGKSIIVFVGAIEPYKGPHILLEAMARVVKSVPDTELVFVGKGSMVEDLISMSRRLNIQDNIRFVGFVSDNQRKAMYYRSADVFALPTFAESFGNVGLEAIAVGVPVVASNVGGVPDIVRNGEVGILVPPRDPAKLADSLITLLEDSDLRERMGSAGRALAQDYSWDNNAASTERIYEGLLK